MKKIIVFGGTGWVGHNIALVFYNAGYDVTICSRSQTNTYNDEIPKDIKIFSAGLEPKGVHPMAINVMQEVGIDISHQKSKNISEIPIHEISTVVTLCGDAAERCPVFPGKVKMIHWALKTAPE